jgi:PEGA domain
MAEEVQSGNDCGTPRNVPGELPMFLNRLNRSLPIVALCLAGVTAARAQSTAEYGAATSNSGTAVAKVKVPIPKITLPVTASTQSSAPAARSSPASIPGADTAAANNRLALQKRAGPDAAEVSLGSVPDHALVWVDTQFVGTTPMKLNLAPGQHRVRMSEPDMEAVYEDVDLAAKQPKQVVVSLKPRVAAKAPDPQ